MNSYEKQLVETARLQLGLSPYLNAEQKSTIDELFRKIMKICDEGEKK